MKGCSTDKKRSENEYNMESFETRTKSEKIKLFIKKSFKDLNIVFSTK